MRSFVNFLHYANDISVDYSKCTQQKWVAPGTKHPKIRHKNVSGLKKLITSPCYVPIIRGRGVMIMKMYTLHTCMSY